MKRSALGQTCEDAPFTLTDEEALLVLEPYFEAVRERYLESGLRRASDVRLHLSEWAHDSPRHFGMTTSDGKLVTVAPHLAGMPEDTVVAIMAHEFGHACDFLSPSRYQLRDRALVEWATRDWSEGRVSGAEEDPKAAYNRSKQWESREDDEVERTADAIAERVMQRPIYYAGPCMVQSLAGGIRPRPAGLR